MASSGVRMSLNMIAASKPKRRMGCSVTSQAASGRAAQLVERVLLAHFLVLGQVAAGLAHDPDGGALAGLAAQVLQEDAVLDVGHGHQLHDLKVSATAATVVSMSASVWAALTKPTSQPEGAR